MGKIYATYVGREIKVSSLTNYCCQKVISKVRILLFNGVTCHEYITITSTGLYNGTHCIKVLSNFCLTQQLF